MRGKKITLIILGIIILISTLLLSFMNFFENRDLKIVTPKNSSAFKYAIKEKISVEAMADSEKEKYFTKSNTNDFEYNVTNQKIEITKYNGFLNTIIIPEKIENKKVTTVSLNLTDKKISSIYISNNVKTISLNYKKSGYSKLFWISIIFVLISFIIYSGVNIALFSKTIKQDFNNTPINIITLIYLIFQCVYSYMANSNYDEINKFVIISVVALLIYILLLTSLILARNKIEKNEEQINTMKESFMNKAMAIIDDLIVNEENQNVSQKLKKLKEKIQYSDPVSKENVMNLESDIIELLNQIKKEDNKEEVIGKIIGLIEKRNRIVKESK